MTLDDVSCFMHLSIEGMLFDHNGPVSMTDVVDMMVQLLGADVAKTVEQVGMINDVHARFSQLKEIFKERLREASEAQVAGDIPELQQKWDQSLRIYLLYLVGIVVATKVSIYVIVSTGTGAIF